MATSRTNRTTTNKSERHLKTWQLIVMIATATAGIGGAGYFLGQTVESTQSNLKEAKFIQECNEKLEVERQKLSDFKTQMNEKRFDDLTKTVELLQQTNTDGRKK